MANKIIQMTDGSDNIYPQTALRWWIYKGKLLGSPAASTSAEGYGYATIIREPSGLYRIEYTASITTADSSATSDFRFGVVPSLFTATIGTTLTPKSGGHWLVFDTNGALIVNTIGFSGVHTATANNDAWSLARMYTTDGSIGSWPASKWTVGNRITGVCYGQ